MNGKLVFFKIKLLSFSWYWILLLSGYGSVSFLPGSASAENLVWIRIRNNEFFRSWIRMRTGYLSKWYGSTTLLHGTNNNNIHDLMCQFYDAVKKVTDWYKYCIYDITHDFQWIVPFMLVVKHFVSQDWPLQWWGVRMNRISSRITDIRKGRISSKFS